MNKSDSIFFAMIFVAAFGTGCIGAAEIFQECATNSFLESKQCAIDLATENAEQKLEHFINSLRRIASRKLDAILERVANNVASLEFDDQMVLHAELDYILQSAGKLVDRELNQLVTVRIDSPLSTAPVVPPAMPPVITEIPVTLSARRSDKAVMTSSELRNLFLKAYAGEQGAASLLNDFFRVAWREILEWDMTRHNFFSTLLDVLIQTGEEEVTLAVTEAVLRRVLERDRKSVLTLLENIRQPHKAETEKSTALIEILQLMSKSKFF